MKTNHDDSRACLIDDEGPKLAESTPQLEYSEISNNDHTTSKKPRFSGTFHKLVDDREEPILQPPVPPIKVIPLLNPGLKQEKRSLYLEKFRKGARKVQLQAKLTRYLKETLKNTDKQPTDPNVFKWKDLIELDNKPDPIPKKKITLKSEERERSSLPTPAIQPKTEISQKKNSPVKIVSFLKNWIPKALQKNSCMKSCSKKALDFINRLFKSTLARYLYTLLIIFSIFGDDVRRMSTDFSKDIITDAILFSIMAVFMLEILWNVIEQRSSYIKSSDLWFDLIATLSIGIELSIVSETFLAPYDK